MPALAKYTEVMSVIERRIRAGDYLLDDFPGERKIAEETGVSYMTARKAVAELLSRKVLIRQPSGALGIHPSYAKLAQLAEAVLLYPAYPSSYLIQLRGLVSDFAQRQGFKLRPVQFVHWDERTVTEAAEQARATFVIPHGPSIPTRLLEVFRANRVVVLDGDFSADGLPSIRLFSDACIETVLEHLYRLGHRRVDCLNTQNRNPEIDRRVGIWRRWLATRRLQGELFDDPAKEFTDPTVKAYQLVSRLLDENHVRGSAIVGTTCPAVIGALRACWERGISVGDELSLCAMNIEPPSEFFCPAITGLKLPDLSDILSRCVSWMFGKGDYRGTYLLEPEKAALFVGESTQRPTQRRST